MRPVDLGHSDDLALSLDSKLGFFEKARSRFNLSRDGISPPWGSCALMLFLYAVRLWRLLRSGQ